MSSLITAGDATNGVSLTAGSNGTLIIRSGLAGAKVDALSIAADGTPTWAKPPINLGTVQNTTSGTSIDFTGIPAGVRRVTLNFLGVSTNGGSSPLVQLGISTGPVTTGYGCTGSLSASTVTSQNFTTGFGDRAQAAEAIRSGSWTFALFAANTWVCSGVLGRSDFPATSITGGSIVLSGTLDRLRLTTVNGTDTFDAGSVNIMWEF